MDLPCVWSYLCAGMIRTELGIDVKLCSVIDKHQHMHRTFNSILVWNVDFNVKIHKNT